MGSYHYVGLGILLAKGRRAVNQAVTESCEDLVGKAQAVTPVNTGALGSSIHVASVVQSGFSVTGTVSTGGEADEYAIFQHEGTSRGVPPTKFLERPLIAHAPEYRKAIERAARGEF